MKIIYKEYEKEVYNWLNNKNKLDINFTFSLRQNGSKGAELDYFIGTEKSRYFAVTFWTLPVGFPGSSGDCIGLVFKVSANYLNYSYDFKFTQTNSPHDAQNTSALNLIKSSTQNIKASIGAKRVSADDNKMFTIRSKPRQESYTDLNQMLDDIDKDLNKLIPIINNQIEEEKKVNPEFEAHRISKEEFANMEAKLLVRFNKYDVNTNKGVQNYQNLNKDENTFEKTRALLDSSIFDEYIDFVRSVIKSLGLKPQDPRIVYSVRGYSLNFTIGQKYCVNVYASKNKDNFGVISSRKISENNEEYAGKVPLTYYNYVNQLSFNQDEQNTIINAIKELLNKTTKSGYYKSNNTDFENYLFGIKTSVKAVNNMSIAKNQILYGPPGTGKTYFLKEQLFDKYTLKENSITKEKYFEDVVTNLTWWQVITLALIELRTTKVNYILENRWVAKKASLSESKNVRATIWGTLQMHTVTESENVAYKQRQNPLIFDKTNDKKWQLLTDEVKEQSPEIYEILNDVNNFESSPHKEIKNYDFVTFHQSFAYEDFIEGIKPILPEEGEETKDLGYAIENGVFKKLCLRAKNDPENRYAIFIDEINRGNVSAIFGELITLIETDKRKGAKNELSIKLPYSKKEFSVPSNLDIYGTMNTADRSVEALDTALRRRFEFKEMMPDYSVIENEEVNGILLSEVLKTINERIELLIDRDHTIGHSYFFNVKTKEALAKAFNNKIVPLLQEYFYGDYGKIGLVLGKGFVKKQKNNKIKFADFTYENANDFINPSFVLKKVDSDTILEAVLTLLGNKEAE